VFRDRKVCLALKVLLGLPAQQALKGHKARQGLQDK